MYKLFLKKTDEVIGYRCVFHSYIDTGKPEKGRCQWRLFFGGISPAGFIRGQQRIVRSQLDRQYSK